MVYTFTLVCDHYAARLHPNDKTSACSKWTWTEWTWSTPFNFPCLLRFYCAQHRVGWVHTFHKIHGILAHTCRCMIGRVKKRAALAAGRNTWSTRMVYKRVYLVRVSCIDDFWMGNLNRKHSTFRIYTFNGLCYFCFPWSVVFSTRFVTSDRGPETCILLCISTFIRILISTSRRCSAVFACNGNHN